LHDTLVIHYDEIALKGRNRGVFERRLLRTVREIARSIAPVEARKSYGRLILTASGETPDLSALASRLCVLPGVRYVLEGVEGPWELDDLLDRVVTVLPEQDAVQTFGVRVKRADKRYPLRSSELERVVGARVLEHRSWGVDLREPDCWLKIEIVNGRVFLCTRRHDGPGGLPTGVSGRGVILLSGGIDSPVAAWMMMTRGMQLSAVHFHSAPYTNRRSQEKVRDLARQLVRYQPVLALTMIPFADPIQQAIITTAPPKYRVILYRRFMMRLAGRAAEESRATCIVTGEALGQVASQTIENMTTVEASAELPVLRPLVGMPKASIIDVARRIDTFHISIEPHDDCCSYLMPRHPATHSTPSELEQAESALDVDGLIEETWASRETEILRFD